MTVFIRKLRPGFEALMIGSGHWYPVLNLDSDRICFSVNRRRSWQDTFKGIEENVSFRIVEGEGEDHAPKDEWKFRWPFLVERKRGYQEDLQRKRRDPETVTQPENRVSKRSVMQRKPSKLRLFIMNPKVMFCLLQSTASYCIVREGRLRDIARSATRF